MKLILAAVAASAVLSGCVGDSRPYYGPPPGGPPPGAFRSGGEFGRGQERVHINETINESGRGSGGGSRQLIDCKTGVHFEKFPKSTMSQTQFDELENYLSNYDCDKQPAPRWLLENPTWVYGDRPPAKGSF